jgi:hypothetical protein
VGGRWRAGRWGGQAARNGVSMNKHGEAFAARQGGGCGVWGGEGGGGGCLRAHELAHDWGALRLNNCILLQLLLLLHAIILVFLVHVQLVFERGLYALDLILKGK